jgi:4-amino-4-deoxy-L-arabinose transferase
MGLAILTKWLPGLIVAPIWILLLYDSQNFKIKALTIHFLVFLGVAILIFLPWQIYIFNTFPNEAIWESSFNKKHFFEVIEERSGSVLYYLNQMRKNYGDLIYLPFIWFVYLIIKQINHFKNLALLIWIGIPLLFFTIAKTKMQAYILFTSPALFIITAAFFMDINKFKINFTKKWFVLSIQFLMLILPLRYMIERVKPFASITRQPDWVVDLKALKQSKFKDGVLFNCSNYIEAMFYTDLIAYEKVGDQKTIKSLQKQGKIIIINVNRPLPSELKNIHRVIYVKLRDQNE